MPKSFQVSDTEQCRERTMVYTYDVGDGGEHLLTMAGREPVTSKFRCLGEAGHPIAEGVKHTRRANPKTAYRAV